MFPYYKLKEPFDPDVVSWRVGSMTKDKSKGMALAYVDARDVMARLDDVVGAQNWECDYTPMPNGSACCRIGIWIPDHKRVVWKSNGSVNFSSSDESSAREIAEKGSYSDAFKRAAVLWGVGRYLYSLDTPWVKLDQYRQIDKSELPRLKGLLAGKKPTSARQSKDVWHKLAEGLDACRSEQAVADYLEKNSAIISSMPNSWHDHWNDKIGVVMTRLREAS